jgi:hypothetical protein
MQKFHIRSKNYYEVPVPLVPEPLELGAPTIHPSTHPSLSNRHRSNYGCGGRKIP